MNWIPLLWLAATLALLLLVERWIHRHMQGVMLLLTGDREIAVMLYALPLLPGIILHELSHAFMALLLGVQVGRISIRPKLANRRIQLGFIPVDKTDVVRASLIGLAPLLIGSAAILLIGYLAFDIGTVGAAFVAGNWTNLFTDLLGTLEAPDLWIWAYVIFAVSNTMMPSRSDRQTWMPVILFLLLIGVLIWATGLGAVVVEGVASLTADPPQGCRPLRDCALTTALRWLTAMYAFTIAVDLPFILLIALLEGLLARVKGVRVEY